MTDQEGDGHGSNVPLTEPVVVPCCFVSGVNVLRADGIVRFVGYVELPPLGDGAERRIVVRFVMTREPAKALRDDLTRLLKRPGN